jgi:hypothetical protein
MDTVYILWHTHPTGAGEENEKLIGVYATEESALAAQSRLLSKPGFSSFPQGFEIAACPVGKDHWEEGYFTE